MPTPLSCEITMEVFDHICNLRFGHYETFEDSSPLDCEGVVWWLLKQKGLPVYWEITGVVVTFIMSTGNYNTVQTRYAV